MSDQDTFELRQIIYVVRRWLRFIVASVFIAFVLGFFVTSQMDPTYEATASLLVVPSKDSKATEYSTLIAAERLAFTYSQMMKGNSLLSQVIEDLGLDIKPKQLASRISPEPVTETQLVRIKVKDTSPDLAAKIANQLATVFVDYLENIQAGRYANSLVNKKQEMDDLSKKIEEAKVSIVQLEAQKIGDENERTQVQTMIVELRSDHRLLQQDYQEVQLTIAQLKDNVRIIETAKAPERITSLPYTASVILVVEQNLLTGGSDLTSILASERLTLTYAQMLKSRNVLEEAISLLEIPDSPENLLNKIEVNPIKDTQLIELQVIDYNPTRGDQLANTISEVFVRQVQEGLAGPYTDRLTYIQNRMDEITAQLEGFEVDYANLSLAIVQAETEIKHLENLLTSDSNNLLLMEQELGRLQQISTDAAEAVYFVEPASIPERPTQNRMLYLGIATLTGAVLGLGLAFLLEYLDDTIKTPEDVTKTLGLACLGKIGTSFQEDGKLVTISQPLSPIAESFRVLAMNIRFASLDKPFRSLVVTSPSSEEGKSFVIANLAVVMARSETNVVTVDADLRLPQQHSLFGLEQQGEGLTGALLAGNIDSHLQKVEVDGLRILPSGKLPSDPVEVIGSAKMRDLIHKLKKTANLVLIDCPPVLPVADASLLATLTDGVLLVIRANQTRKSLALETLQGLNQAGAKVIGVVLNAMPNTSEGKNRYYKEEKPTSKWLIYSRRLVNVTGRGMTAGFHAAQKLISYFRTKAVVRTQNKQSNIRKTIVKKTAVKKSGAERTKRQLPNK